MKIILSPAKNIDLNKHLDTEIITCPIFIAEATTLIHKLKKISAKKISTMMHISAELADLNVQRYQDWNEDVEIKEGKGHAIAIFNGEVYRGLDALTMDRTVVLNAQDKIRILSGLYGILKPLDVISPYRLEMGTSWAVTPAKKNLYQFWGNKVTDSLNNEESELIINLASTEYSKVIDFKKLKAKVITPIFKEFKNGDYKIVMVYAKQARGTMARFIISNNITSEEGIKGFNLDGYLYDPNLSKGNEYVFTR